jgi:hypothetical protein
MKQILMVVIALIIVVIVGAGGFFAGTAYGQTQAQNTRNEFIRNRQGNGGGQGGAPGQFGQSGQGGQGGQFGRPAAFGTVKSVNGDTIVLTQTDGSTVNVTVNAQTAIQKTVSGTASDIQPGERITVLSDQTGSNIVARDIQLRPNNPPQN